MKKLSLALLILTGMGGSYRGDTRLANVVALGRTDTTGHVIVLAPVRGDSYPELQQAIDFCIGHPGYRMHLEAGDYYISHPLPALSWISLRILSWVGQ